MNEATAEEVCEALGADAFAKAWADGRALSADKALELALEALG